MARTGLAQIREDLRGLTEAGTADWTAGTTSYFTDDVLDVILDRHCEPFTFEGMEIEEPRKTSAGAFVWTKYEIEDRANIEQTTGGTAVFYVQDNTGGTIASSEYSVDYRRGVVTFNADTLGYPYYATGTAFDLNASAADIWRMKANHAASAVDFSTDNHSIKRSQVYTNYMKMADYYQGLSEQTAGGSGMMEREDTDNASD